MVAQPQLEELNPEGESPQQSERIVSQLPAESISQEESEKVNVLVNDGSSVGAYTLDMIAPPKLTSEITQLQR